MFIIGYALGVATTLFVVRFKDALLFWKKRVEKDIEDKLKGN